MGGFGGRPCERARIKADWLVPLPEGMTTRQVMSMGTAGLTAALSIMALENQGVTPDGGEVWSPARLVCWFVAVTMLAKRGYSVAASQDALRRRII